MAYCCAMRVCAIWPVPEHIGSHFNIRWQFRRKCNYWLQDVTWNYGPNRRPQNKKHDVLVCSFVVKIRMQIMKRTETFCTKFSRFEFKKIPDDASLSDLTESHHSVSHCKKNVCISGSRDSSGGTVNTLWAGRSKRQEMFLLSTAARHRLQADPAYAVDTGSKTAEA
jgi:hypothetical protein